MHTLATSGARISDVARLQTVTVAETLLVASLGPCPVAGKLQPWSCIYRLKSRTVPCTCTPYSWRSSCSNGQGSLFLPHTIVYARKGVAEHRSRRSQYSQVGEVSSNDLPTEDVRRDVLRCSQGRGLNANRRWD